jgi:predicted PurR-regulated permease PerM
VIAIGVVVVGRLFGVVGLFVAVPIVSGIVILAEEYWVKEVEAAHESRTTGALTALPPTGEPLDEVQREEVTT